jgi:hypothetical protein
MARAKLDDYINQVCFNPIGKRPKYCTGWDAASLLGCPTVTIDGRNCSPFSCVLRDCALCQDKWKDMIPTREKTCTDMISYVLFGSHSKCSYHGDNYMRLEGKEYHCTICDSMTDEQRGKLKAVCPKVKQVKLRIMLREEMKEFVKPGGTYETYSWKMFHHATHVKLLGLKFGVQKCYNYSENNDGIIVTKMDYSERYQPILMQAIQSENFARDANLSMEI